MGIFTCPGLKPTFSISSPRRTTLVVACTIARRIWLISTL